MRMVTMVLVSAAAMLVPALASADPAPTQAAPAPSMQTAPAPTVTAQTAPVAAASSTSDLDEVVCRMTPPATGSRLGGARECHTAREWNRRQQNSQDTLMKSQSVGMQQPLKTLGGSH